MRHFSDNVYWIVNDEGCHVKKKVGTRRGTFLQKSSRELRYLQGIVNLTGG